MTLERRTTFIRGVFIHNQRTAELIATLPESAFSGKRCSKIAVFFLLLIAIIVIEKRANLENGKIMVIASCVTFILIVVVMG
jgi:hypothetical protein